MFMKSLGKRTRGKRYGGKSASGSMPHALLPTERDIAEFQLQVLFELMRLHRIEEEDGVKREVVLEKFHDVVDRIVVVSNENKVKGTPLEGWQAASNTSLAERVARVRELNLKLRTPNGLSDLERTPAYRRKNIDLGRSPLPIEARVIRHNLYDSDEGSTMIIITPEGEVIRNS